MFALILLTGVRPMQNKFNPSDPQKEYYSHGKGINKYVDPFILTHLKKYLILDCILKLLENRVVIIMMNIMAHTGSVVHRTSWH